ncbi:ABC transporter ATP-binding protein [Alkalicoccobacillus porphyridii]|uniref:ABC transporter ATP-binding protein n=1 Tax=Alkalicoccobacillus porphyridii TaxID=2597270 RepID=A0A553ZVF3_9BACI|nr:ABC transporter ATP-binding protein [Alkalicoccobacillus porphyridii]TSB45460.1 ABC transporter ATP-binding protein [Alkalicoccobacillus porphyridii]
MSNQKLLDVRDLHVSFDTYGGRVHAVRGVNLSLEKGETLAIVGESGCGKSVTAQSIMRLIAEPPGKINKGEILLKGENLLTYSDKKMRSIRGKDISMIFQDPMTSLNPTLTIGDQLTEGLIKHASLSSKDAQKQALQMLDLVGISNAKERLKQFPHQFSGGMRQRIMIAMALICDPEVLIADEPTTALDVTIQAQILDLFKEIQREMGVAIIMITHDLGVVAQLANRIQVMYAGQVVEEGNRRDIFYQPQHPYTRGLLHSVPRMDADRNVPLIPIAGTPPDLFSPPKGCAFADRCEYAMDVCTDYHPPKTSINGQHTVACWLQDDRVKLAYNEDELPMLKKTV